MRLGWKISSPTREFVDSVFTDWADLCEYLMKNEKCELPILIDVVAVM